jgi:hypothetical protein
MCQRQFVCLVVFLPASASLKSCPPVTQAIQLFEKSKKPVPNQYVIQLIESVNPDDISDLADQLVLGQGRGGVKLVYKYAKRFRGAQLSRVGRIILVASTKEHTLYARFYHEQFNASLDVSRQLP